MSQALLLKLLPQQQAVESYPLPGTPAELNPIREQLEDAYQLDLLGFVEMYT